MNDITDSSPKRRPGRPKGARARNLAGMESRDRIIRVALDLFGKQGFHGVSFAHLSAASGLSKATIAHHFSSKENLFSAVLEHVSRDFDSAINSTGAKTPEGAVEQLVIGIANWATAHPAQLRLMAFDLLELPNRSGDPEKWPVLNTVGKALDIIEQGQTKGVISEQDPILLFEAVLGILTYHEMARSVRSQLGRNGSPSDQHSLIYLIRKILTP